MENSGLIILSSMLALNACDDKCHGQDCTDPLCQEWEWNRPDVEWEDGDSSQCEVGRLNENDVLAVMEVVNDLRSYAGLQELVRDTSNDQALQECALMQDMQVELSHDPTSDWDCYTDGGARMAGESSISLGITGVEAVLAFMKDGYGNEETLGHRLDLLDVDGRVFGMGSTGNGGAMCLWVGSEYGSAPYKQFVAWPPDGKVPLVAIRGVDETGLSINLADDFAFLNPVPKVTRHGQDMEVEVINLGWTGDFIRTLSIVPQGWNLVAGESYEVSVQSDVTSTSYLHTDSINYTTQVLDCRSSLFVK